MSRLFSTLMIAGLLSAPAMQAQNAITHNLGLWEIETTLITLSGEGYDLNIEDTTQDCIDTEEEASFFIQELAPGQCTIQGVLADETGASAMMTCYADGTPLDGHIDTRIFNNGDAFGARATLATRVEDYHGQEAMTTFYLYGRRIGDCTADN